MDNLKQSVYETCLGLIESRLESLRSQIKELQQAANNETKSSMGDKYETGRAMMQQEKDKLSERLDQAQKQLQVLNSLNMRSTDSVQLGSLVLTSGPKFFVSISLGRLRLDQEELLVISPMSPVGKSLLGKRIGEKIVFVKDSIEILGIH